MQRNFSYLSVPSIFSEALSAMYQLSLTFQLRFSAMYQSSLTFQLMYSVYLQSTLKKQLSYSQYSVITDSGSVNCILVRVAKTNFHDLFHDFSMTVPRVSISLLKFCIRDILRNGSVNAAFLKGGSFSFVRKECTNLVKSGDKIGKTSLTNHKIP